MPWFRAASWSSSRLIPSDTAGTIDELLHAKGRALRGDEVPVPREAVLRHPLEGVEVDVDDSEAAGVAERPLEVVEERPEEVAAHGHARRDSRSDCVEMALEVGDPPGVRDASVLARVRERRAVLGDVELGWPVR